MYVYISHFHEIVVMYLNCHFKFDVLESAGNLKGFE